MVDQTEVTFDTVKFMEPVSKTIAVANTGQVNGLTIFYGFNIN